jgi:uncharacterized lipoprotein YehR (DUF1307 family)
MKKIISSVLVCVLLVGAIFALASCGKTLSGKYSDALTGLTTYEFNGNKVTVSAGAGNFKVSFDGTYKIAENDEGKTVITFTFEDEDAEKYSGDLPFAEGEENGKKYIKLAGVKYNKAD